MTERGMASISESSRWLRRHAPARSRTWIYRLGGGRLIHWTTRARGTPGGCASAASPGRYPRPSPASRAAREQRRAVEAQRDPLGRSGSRPSRRRSRVRARSSRALPIPGARGRGPTHAATAASSARPTPAPRCGGSTNRSSSHSPSRARKAREGGTEQRIARGLSPALGDQRLGGRALSEQRPAGAPSGVACSSSRSRS